MKRTSRTGASASAASSTASPHGAHDTAPDESPPRRFPELGVAERTTSRYAYGGGYPSAHEGELAGRAAGPGQWPSGPRDAAGAFPTRSANGHGHSHRAYRDRHDSEGSDDIDPVRQRYAGDYADDPYDALDLPLYNTRSVAAAAAGIGMGPGLGGARPDFAGASGAGYGHDGVEVGLGQEARRRGGGVGAGPGPTLIGGYGDSHDEKAGGAAAGVSDWARASLVEDDTGKTLGSKGYEAGPGRGGRRGLPPMTMRKPRTWREALVYHDELVWSVVYTLLAMFTRYYKIGWANYVVWDEAHFGKFGSHYINRDFYFDVHPPLGKMLVGLAGLLSGYTGGFEFKSGVQYPDDVPYTAMRVLLATFGVGLVPVAWWTAGEFGWSKWTRHWVTLCVLCDVGWLVISRFILLDSMLLFFTFCTVLGLVKFHNQRHDPFGDDWWIWLVFTGLSIGCVCSVKLVGLFVTALVGVYTLEDLWDKFGDLKMQWRTYLNHWIARGVCLILIPLSVYVVSFKIHFLILDRSGPGDAQMSSLFQAHLRGNDFAESPLEVAFGSKLTLKNYGYGGGLLHSHVQTYPVGSLQQQVTCYHYKDDNNHFNIMPTWDEPEYNPEAPIRYLQNGDKIRLVHTATGRNIHSHNVPAPMSKLNLEVSGYGNATVGDANDVWEVEVVDDLLLGKKDNVERIHSLTTRLRFRHSLLGCYMRAGNVGLPQWGFKQIEVSCDKQNNPKDVHTYWNVESHWNDRLPRGNLKLYKSPFFRDFWHLNVAMMTSNNALVPDPDKDDILASKALDWPFQHLGLRMCGWGENQVKYYLLGTPVVWWGSTISLFVAGFTFVVFLMRMQRQYKDWLPGQWDNHTYVLKIAAYGWLFHYLPFLVMGRVTYLHHYLPTLWFAVLMAGHMLDTFLFGSPRLGRSTKAIAFWLLAGSVVGCFWWFRGVAWGIDGPIEKAWGLGWRKSWNLYNGGI